MEGTDGSAHGLVTSDRRQTAFFAGMGFYFFGPPRTVAEAAPAGRPYRIVA